MPSLMRWQCHWGSHAHEVPRRGATGGAGRERATEQATEGEGAVSVLWVAEWFVVFFLLRALM